MASHTLAWDETPAAVCRGGALTFGNFDGVHRGHAALVAELRRPADAVGGPAAPVTFDPHPLQLLRPEQFQPVLTTVADRAALLQACGAEHVVILRTTPGLLHLTAREFFGQVIRERFQARALVEGYNFGFGRNREGNVDTLRELCAAAGLGLTVVPPWQAGRPPLSRSPVRPALERGHLAAAALLPGRPDRL